jgi:hypothetical protein
MSFRVSQEKEDLTPDREFARIVGEVGCCWKPLDFRFNAVRSVVDGRDGCRCAVRHGKLVKCVRECACFPV